MENRPSTFGTNDTDRTEYDRGGPAGGGTAMPSMEDVKEKAGQVGHQAQAKAGELMDQARTQVKTQISEQKSRAAEMVETFAHALHSAGEQLDQQNQQPVARVAHSAADMVENVSGFLREKDVDDMVHAVEAFARRQPAVFIGSAFALGFMAARFLKASGSDGGSSRGYSRDYSRDYTLDKEYEGTIRRGGPNLYEPERVRREAYRSTGTGAAYEADLMETDDEVDQVGTYGTYGGSTTS